jgi:hypothetical protein
MGWEIEANTNDADHAIRLEQLTMQEASRNGSGRTPHGHTAECAGVGVHLPSAGPATWVGGPPRASESGGERATQLCHWRESSRMWMTESTDGRHNSRWTWEYTSKRASVQVCHGWRAAEE